MPPITAAAGAWPWDLWRAPGGSSKGLKWALGLAKRDSSAGVEKEGVGFLPLVEREEKVGKGLVVCSSFGLLVGEGVGKEGGKRGKGGSGENKKKTVQREGQETHFAL